MAMCLPSVHGLQLGFSDFWLLWVCRFKPGFLQYIFSTWPLLPASLLMRDVWECACHVHALSTWLATCCFRYLAGSSDRVTHQIVIQDTAYSANAQRMHMSVLKQSAAMYHTIKTLPHLQCTKICCCRYLLTQSLQTAPSCQ